MTIAIPSETAFNYIFLTALGFAILAALVTLLITGRSDQVHIEREREEPVKPIGPEVEVGVGVEVEHPNVQIPKWPHDADAASDRIIAYTATPLGVNNSPVLSEREPGYRSSSFPMTDSPPMTELYGYRIEFMVRDSKKPNGENDITILAANGRISQLRVKRSREGDDHVQEVTFTASDSSGGETHAAVAVRSADAERQHSIRFMPDKPNDYAIELVVRGGLVAHGADAVTVKAVDADINQLRAERSGEGDAQIQEITFTASDGSGGEMRGGGGAFRCKTVCCKYIDDV